METNPVIVTDGLSRRFKNVIAVNDLTLQVYAGEVFGFLGHNGAGKTTTVRLLAGLLAPNDGTTRVLHLDPITDGLALRRRIGVLPETPSLDERLTARDNLKTYAELYNVPRADIPHRIAELLETFELTDHADQRVRTYSKGMKQRLALARVLFHRPELLFLDEPTAGLDPVAARRVHAMIARLRHQERTVFLCTHNLTEAQSLCDRVAVLERGRLVALGTPAELARQLVHRLHLEFEIASDGLPVALNVLRAAHGVTDLTQKNGSITVVGNNREVIPGLVTSLAAAGVRIYRVTPQEPTLEDVYFALHGKEEVKT